MIKVKLMWAGIVSRIRSANRLKRFTKLRKGLIITAAGLAALGMTLTSVAQTGHANPSQLQHLDSQEKQVVLKVEDQAVQNPAKFQEKKDSYKKISSAAIRISQFVTMANNALLIGSPSFDEAERLLLRAHNEFKLIQERLLGEDIFVSSTLVINLMQDLDYSTDRMVGFDWDDAGKFLPVYVEKGLVEKDPFVSIDIEGVGNLMELSVKKSRKVNPKIKLGVCGEHGGDPASIEFCNKIGLDYVSCSPFRVPIARLAAAQAVLKSEKS